MVSEDNPSLCALRRGQPFLEGCEGYWKESGKEVEEGGEPCLMRR